MSDFMHSHWHIHSSIYWKTYQDVTHDFIVPDDYEHGRDFYIAAVPDRKDACLIAVAPEIYRLLKVMCKIHAMKSQALTDKNDSAFMNAVMAQDGAVKMAEELLACIDAEEAQS